MSRVGKAPVVIPGGVTCEISGSTLKVTGPNGTLEQTFNPDMTISVSDTEVTVSRPSEKKAHCALHGLTRALIQNMVNGVTTGYNKTLIITGVGYRVAMEGPALNLSLGFSHPVKVAPPEGITFTVDGTQIVRVAGIEKQLVGQVAANIRALRKPEPYKGKGIRYENERIRRKVGKAGSK